MAEYQWTGGADTGDFSTPTNWQNLTTSQNPATSPPGPSDDAIIVGTGVTITGSGTPYRFLFNGTGDIAAQLTTTFGAQCNGVGTMNRGAILTTPLLGVAFAINDTGTLVITDRSRVVIAQTPTTGGIYGLAVGDGAGSTGKLEVSGTGAALTSNTAPIAIGLSGTGHVRITNNGRVTAAPMPAQGFGDAPPRPQHRIERFRRNRLRLVSNPRRYSRRWPQGRATSPSMACSPHRI